jgi:hypothetical protein
MSVAGVLSRKEPSRHRFALILQQSEVMSNVGCVAGLSLEFCGRDACSAIYVGVLR